MKFYTTILTAIVLLGLCVLEKKAKESMTVKVMEEHSQKTFLTSFGENEKGSDSQQLANQNPDLLTMASPDSSSKSSLFLGKTLLNLSIGELFTAQP
jgi:hypothetical protein